MAYTFELVFTGLCVFTTEGGLAKPTRLDVVLVDHPRASKPGDEHVPCFTCRGRNLTRPVKAGSGFEIVPDPDGDTLVRYRLTGNERVTVSFQSGLPESLAPNWSAAKTGEKPGRTAEANFLDWVTPLEKIFPSIKPTPKGARYGGLDVSHSPVVTLTQGAIRAEAIAKHPLLQEYLSWDFLVNGSGTYDPDAAQALAGKIIVKVDVTEGPIKIKATNGKWELHLVPAIVDGVAEPMVRASITSLPLQEPTNVGYLKHFEHLSHLIPASLEPGTPRFPKSKPHDTATSDDTFCPPPWRKL